MFKINFEIGTTFMTKNNSEKYKLKTLSPAALAE